MLDNLNPSEYTFGNLGGVVYYNTESFFYRKGSSSSYILLPIEAISIEQWLLITMDCLKNGWAFHILLASRRWADRR